jgi:hypothetical protein
MLVLKVKPGQSIDLTLEDGRQIKIIRGADRTHKYVIDAPRSIAAKVGTDTHEEALARTRGGRRVPVSRHRPE